MKLRFPKSRYFALLAFAYLQHHASAQVVLAPWSEAFSGVTKGTPNYNAGSTIPTGWTRTPATTGNTPPTATYWWGGSQGLTHTRAGGGTTGPAADHTSGTGGYVYVESSGGPGNSVANLISPPISTVGIATPELIFWKHQYGQTMGLLKVYTRPFGATAWDATPIYTGTNANLGDVWTRVAVTLPSNYVNDTLQLRFEMTKPAGGGGGGPGGGGGNQFGDLAIDDVSIAQLVTCPAPSNLVATRLTANSIQLSWTTGGATTWRVSYGLPGFNPTTGTKLTVTSNPFVVTGLLPSTSYEFRVKDSCSATDVSSWSSSAKAMTDCGPVPAPWMEDFEDANWVVPATHWAYGAIDTCWSRPSGANYWWRPNSGPTPTALTNIGTGPSSDHTTGSGRYMHGEAQTGTGVAVLRSPSVILAGLLNPELRFYYHQFGAQIDSLVVKIFRNNAETRVWGNAQQTASSTAPWTEAVISLASFLPDTVQVRWYAYRSPSNQNQVDVAIDDVSIDNPPACPKPTGLTVTSTTQSTGTMIWNPTGAGTYEVRYGPLGQVPFSGTTVTATTNPFTLTGLSAGTVYAVSVRKVCSTSLQSAWSTVDTLITLCGVVAAPYVENFEVGFNPGPASGQFWNQNSTIGACWTRIPTSSGTTPTYHWGGGQGATPTANTGPDNDHTTGLGKYVYTEGGFGNPAGSVRVATLTSPQIILSALTAPELRFWYHMQGATVGSLSVEVQTGSSTSPFVVIDSIVGAQGAQWNERVVSLTAYGNQTVRIRFRSRTLGSTPATQADIAIDDFSVKNAPPCPPPTALTVTPLTATTASVAFTNSGNGTATIEYGPVGFTPGSGTLVKTTSNPFILTGLTQGQSYHAYVYDSCAGGLTSTKFGPAQFSTFNCPNGCVYNLKLRDSFGDGWRTNPQGTLFHALEVVINGTATSYTLPGATDTAASFVIPVCDNDVVQLRFVNRGNWSNECGWIFRDATGTVVHSEATGGPNLTTGIKFTDTADCSNPCPPPAAAFTTTATGLTVNFSGATSVGTISTYAWNFGGGATGSGVTASHTFSSFGSYPITLVVTDGCGQIDTLVDTINVCTGGLGSVSHSANGLVVGFTGPTDPGQFTSITWNFGDGGTGSGAAPSHTYTSGGTYTVIVSATDNCGNTYSQTLTVVVCAKPVGYFTFRVLLSNGSGMQMEFDASATTGATQYNWLWGDGTASVGGPIINHTYPVAQLGYTVRLIVSASCGITDTVYHSLRELGSIEGEAQTGYWAPNPIRSGAPMYWMGGAAVSPETVSLFTADGRSLGIQTTEDGALVMPAVPAGLYWMQWTEADRPRRVQIAVID